MIAQNNNFVSMEQIDKIKQANETVKGTLEYGKYTMQYEYKYKNKNDESFCNWKFVGYGIPIKNMIYHLKKIKNNLYIISEEYEDSFGNLTVDRWLVTDTVKYLLSIN